MRRMLALTMAGGAVAAYFAHPQGFLASALAYLLGGTLCALLGLMSSLYAWGPKGRTGKALGPTRHAAGNSSSSGRETDL